MACVGLRWPNGYRVRLTTTSSRVQKKKKKKKKNRPAWATTMMPRLTRPEIEYLAMDRHRNYTGITSVALKRVSGCGS